MSLFGRALAGAGSAASEIANKYIDDSLARNRAQVLADIQRNSAMQTMRETDAYQNDPSRRDRLRTEGAKDVGADTAARSAASIAAEKAALKDPELSDLKIENSNRTIRGTAPAEAEKIGLVERARALNTAHDVAPGGKVIVGPGSNDNPTAGELNYKALSEGLKGQSKEQRQRYYETLVKSHGDELKEISKQIADGIANGTISATPPPPKTHMFGAAEPGKDPAYDRYQALRKAQNAVSDKRDAVVAAWRADQQGISDGGSAPGSAGSDPVKLRAPGKPGSEAALAGTGVVTPGQEADAKAGMPGNATYGAEDAPRSLAALDREIAKHPVGSEARRILEAERPAIVNAGKGGGTPTGPGSPPVPAAPPATVDRAKDAVKQKVEATPEPLPDNVPAPRGPGAKRDPAMMERARQMNEQRQREAVASADQLIAQRDVRGLYDLQASAAWGYLTPDQKTKALALIRGR